MDLSRAVVVFLTQLISLQVNSAESVNDLNLKNDTPSDDTTTSNIPARFKWAYSAQDSSISEKLREESTEIDYDDVDDPQARAVYWIPTSCDSMTERGYTCVGCGESLHCMGGNFALKAICHGFRPYCFNGRCSSTRGEKCQTQGQETNQGVPVVPANSVVQAELEAAHPVIQAEVEPASSIVEAEVLSANNTLPTEEIAPTIATNVESAAGNV